VSPTTSKDAASKERLLFTFPTDYFGTINALVSATNQLDLTAHHGWRFLIARRLHHAEVIREAVSRNRSHEIFDKTLKFAFCDMAWRFTG
jgi:hypothetical protein